MSPTRMQCKLFWHIYVGSDGNEQNWALYLTDTASGLRYIIIAAKANPYKQHINKEVLL